MDERQGPDRRVSKKGLRDEENDMAVGGMRSPSSSVRRLGSLESFPRLYERQKPMAAMLAAWSRTLWKPGGTRCWSSFMDTPSR